MPRIRLPLSLKVSAWLLLNLVLLGSVALGFLAWKGTLRWESVLADRAGERLHAVAALIGEQVGGAPAAERDAMLSRFEAAYGAEMSLYAEDGTRLAGKGVLPSQVRELCHFRRREGWFMRTGPGRWYSSRGFPASPMMPPPPEHDDGAFPAPPGGVEAPGGPERTPAPPDSLGGGTAAALVPPWAFGREMRFAPAARFLVHTDKPAAYWIGFLVPQTARSPGGREFAPGPFSPGILLVRTGSLWPLLRLLDLQPWLLGVAVAMTLSILFWLPFVSGITRAVGRLTEATGRIAEGRFDTRVPDKRRDEIGALGESVNRMAERLDAAATGHRRFLADVAHELCSPLARLQVATGILEAKVSGEAAAALEDVRSEVQEMSLLVDELLAFTRAGFRNRKPAAPIEIASLANQVLVKENAAGRVEFAVPQGLRALGDSDLLGRALRNLVRNALRYAGPAAHIRLAARAGEQHVTVAVEDDGPGVSPEALAHLGEPFYRPESARTRESGGFGLGLAIVKSGIEACGGEVRFSNREPRGFSCEIRLPAAGA